MISRDTVFSEGKSNFLGDFTECRIPSDTRPWFCIVCTQIYIIAGFQTSGSDQFVQLLYIDFTTIGKLNTIILQCSILGLKTQLLCMGHRWCALSIVKSLWFCHFYSKITRVGWFLQWL